MIQLFNKKEKIPVLKEDPYEKFEKRRKEWLYGSVSHTWSLPWTLERLSTNDRQLSRRVHELEKRLNAIEGISEPDVLPPKIYEYNIMEWLDDPTG